MTGVLESVYGRRRLISLQGMDGNEIRGLVALASELEQEPRKYQLPGTKILLYFAKKSLRTQATFDAATADLGMHVNTVFAENTNSQEPIKDKARIYAGLYDIVMARLGPQSEIEEWSRYSRRVFNGCETVIPVINGLTDDHHPCQILSDIHYIIKKFRYVRGLKLAYVGDGAINITHDLMLACSALGIDISVATPEGYGPKPHIIAEAYRNTKLTNSKVDVINNPRKAVEGAHVVYTDTWQSMHVKKDEVAERMQVLAPYQVNKELMNCAMPNAIFMHCLPAYRGEEVTEDVIDVVDGPGSTTIRQAINRVHMQKAIILALMGNSIKVF